MPSSSLSRSGRRRLVLLAAAVVSLTVATSTDAANHFRWLDCPSPAPAPSPSPSPPPPPSTINFHSNVIALLHALPSAAAPTGFASLSRGEGTDRGFVRGLCRGESAPDVCARCLRRAVLHIDRHCSSHRHRRRRAGIWYDKCFLSYADTDTSTTYEEGFRQGLLYNHRNISVDKDVFHRNESYIDFVINISILAVHGGSSELASAVPMFATGEEAVYDRGAPNGTMYGMVQCMRDRTASECALCLWNSMWQLELLNWGGEMLGYNCYLRVEFYAFYNLSLSAVPAPPPPLAPAPSSFMPTAVGGRNSKATFSQTCNCCASSLLFISN